MVPTIDINLVEDLKDHALAKAKDVDHAILHLAAAMAGMCNSRTEARAVAAFAFSGVRQIEDKSFDPNVIMMGDYRVT